jgi:DNA-binding CsgD family transcriptional regulator
MPGWEGPSLPTRWSAAGRPSFVGRHHELAALESAWLAASQGARQAIFVGGEPGAGKSRLVAEVCLELQRLGAAVLTGSCVAELGLPYQPFEDPVSDLRAGVLDGSLAFDDSLRCAAGPEVAEQLGAILGHDRPGTFGRGGGEQREAYDAVRAALCSAARLRPVVLALEDLHWAGASSLSMLAHLIERTENSRLLVLCTHRTTAPDRSGPLVEQISALYHLDGVRRMDLPPLDTEEIAEYLSQQARVPRQRALPAAVILRDSTGGNAFFLREAWHDLHRQGGLAALKAGSVSSPSEAVRGAVRHRLDGLSVEQLAVLAVAAVIGEEVDAALLLSVVGPQEGLETLDAVVSTGLLERIPGQQTAYRFLHALGRQAVLDLTPSAQQARLHEQVAVVLEAREAPVQLLAHHYSSAHLLGHAAKAVRYLVQAAQVASHRLAHAEAAVLLERAAELAQTQYEREGHVLMAAHSHVMASQFETARQLLQAVATTSHHPGRRLAAATAYEDVAWITVESGHLALALLDAALGQLAPDPADPDYVRALAGRARATAHTGAHGGAEELVAEALTLARAIGDEPLVADVLAASMQVGFRPATHPSKLVRAEELATLATRLRRWPHLGPSAYHRALISYARGDALGVAAAKDDLARTARAAGQRYWVYMAGCVDFALHLAGARFDDALHSCEALLKIGESFDDIEAEGPYGVQSYMIRRESGGLEAIRPLIVADLVTEDRWRPGLLSLYVELGLYERAAALLKQVLAHELDPSSGRWPGVIVFVAEAALALGDVEAAEQIRPMLDEYAGLNIVMGPFVAVFGAADRYVAALDSLLGQGTPDETFAAALALDTRTGAALHRAHTLAAWARHARRAGNAEHARTLALATREVAEPLQMTRVLAMLGDSRPVPALHGLTAREAEVLALLGQGLSNRSIAYALRISENTAANHVRNILIKTGWANRTEAAVNAPRVGD